MRKTDIYEGFGAQHTAGVWAELIDIPFRIFQYYVDSEGLTVEGIYARYGYSYKAPEPKKRKPREGKYIAQTRQRMYELLVLSGYVLEEGPECVTVRAADTNGNHYVDFQKRRIGRYNYRTGALQLSGGGGIPLRKMDEAGLDARIRQNSAGFWVAHPETQKKVVQIALSDRPGEGEITQAEYEDRTRKYKNDPASERWEKYEGFGHSYTAAEWARRLGVSRVTLWRHLTAGETVEEFVAKRKK